MGIDWNPVGPLFGQRPDVPCRHAVRDNDLSAEDGTGQLHFVRRGPVEVSHGRAIAMRVAPREWKQAESA